MVALRRLAHSLRGSAGYIHAAGVQQAAMHLESIAHEALQTNPSADCVKQLSPALEELEDKFDELTATLKILVPHLEHQV
mmetsp:Transcript_62726/g.104409  ORF Transcript_62726/g.104409 Transcript_62726/m.104409 type:complete len:80 (-) Transcript_62726:393-632(-)